ncbi:MAG TPA: metallophosphoesterase family protein, partial [Methylophilaceae bacterium]|nr:metallophosphoesterase family protein [Methylophilaceae bacterium]
MLRIGLISDTHGLLRPEALNALRGSNHVIHAGDIGNESILQALARIAPVSAVRGNNDTAEWARELPESSRLQFEGASLFVIHDIKALSISPQAEGIGVVVSGHSHRPKAEIRNGVLFINPG